MRRQTLAAPPPDPFREHRPARWVDERTLLGALFRFETDSRRLLAIVRRAYGQLPAQRFAPPGAECTVRLVRAPLARSSRRDEPPRLHTVSGGGILAALPDGASFVALSPEQRSALGRDLLGHPYHVRYELLEFAVYVLAARAQGLLPLHAACLGHRGAGLLVIGASGSGKSTLVLQGLFGGLDFLAEDSVLVRPRGLLATGISSYVHVRMDGLRFLTPPQRARLRGAGRRILRRSGVAKLEIDVRSRKLSLADEPLPIRAVVFLSRRLRRGSALLSALTPAELLRRLVSAERYAAQQPGWDQFCARIARLPGYELRRGEHPRQAIAELKRILARLGPRKRAVMRPRASRARVSASRPPPPSDPRDARRAETRSAT
jgi:hypothetical protein